MLFWGFDQCKKVSTMIQDYCSGLYFEREFYLQKTEFTEIDLTFDSTRYEIGIVIIFIFQNFLSEESMLSLLG